MAELPSASQLPRAVPVSPAGPSRVISLDTGGAQMLDKASEQMGAALGQIGDAAYKREANLALATADSETLTGFTDLKNKLSQDGDYSTWQERFQKGATEIRQKVRGNLLGRDTQTVYDISAEQQTARFVGQLGNEALERQQDKQRAGLNFLLDNNRKTLSLATDSATREQLMGSTNEAITAATRIGIITENAGVGMRRAFAQGYAKDYVASLPPGDAIRLLGSSLPERYGVKPADGGPVALNEDVAHANIVSMFPGAVVTSGQRSPAHNARVGGVPNSDHIPGNALDFVAPKGTTIAQVRAALTEQGLPIKQLIDEGDHFHWAWGAPQPAAAAPEAAPAPDGREPSAAKTNTPIDFLDVNERRTMYKAAVADARQQTLLDAQVTKLEQEKQASTYLEGLYRGTVKPSDILNSNLPAFGENSKNSLLNLAGNIAQGVTDPGTFQSLYDRIHLPPGAPGAITSAPLIRNYVGNGLSFNDANRLIDDLSGKGTEEGDAIGDMKKSVLDVAKAALVKSNLVSGLFDPNDSVGLGQMLKYRVWFDNAYKAGITAGKSPTQMLDPGSKDYLGRNIDAFKISDTDRMRMSVPRPAPAPVIAPNGRGGNNRARLPGESPDAYLKRIGL